MEIRERRWWDACQTGRDTGRAASEPARSRAGLAPVGAHFEGEGAGCSCHGRSLGLKKARRRWREDSRQGGRLS